LPFEFNQDYGVCADCGCCVNRLPPAPGELERLYSLDYYWRVMSRARKMPTIDERVDLYRSDGRLNFWLALVQKYGPSHGRVLEIGCAPGVLLAELQARGHQCVGVEPDKKTSEWISRKFGVDVRSGLFPAVELPGCDIFLALDLLEHVPDPEGFMKEAARLISDRGRAFIQTPIVRPGQQPPFGKQFEQVFDGLEHLFLFSSRGVKQLVERTGFRVVAEECWKPMFEVIVLEKKAA